ncbi:MAG: hypothetical protein Q9227_009481 [Pyrenula ochraceoflavens]
MFDFFSGSDPTHGFVNYVDQGTAQSGGLINTDNNAVYIGVDHTNTASNSGRSSVRLTSTKSYDHGLVILDLAHMPGGICGTWPAFWMVGADWPNNGEIDIIEGVNSGTTNAMTLHTSSDCSMSSGGFSGSLNTKNCDVNAAGQATNAGCGIDSSSTASYGDGFNSANGGVYATEWTSNGISIYFFPRGSVPSDISGDNPDPTGWGLPAASFGSSSCDIDSHFKGLQIVFDTTFCGDWAGAVWSTDSTCSAKAATCNDYVQNHAGDFKDAYWSVNSLRVYTDNGSAKSNISNSSAGAAPQSSAAAVPASVSAPTALSTQGSMSSALAPVGSKSPATTMTTSAMTTPAPTTMATSASGPLAIEQSNGAVAIPVETPSSAGDATTVTMSAMTYNDFPKERLKRERVRHILRHAQKHGHAGRF